MENSASSFQSNYAIGIKRIYVWENGDFNGNGNVLVINSKLYRSWSAILTLITSALKPTFGTVRNLVRLSNREFVRSFESLESNGKYVALGTDKLKQTKNCYKTAKEKQNVLLSARRPLGINCDEEIGKSTKGKSEQMIIFVLANGTTKVAPCKLILTDADLRSWDAILNLIAQKLDISAGIENVFTLTGDAVEDPRAFRNGDIYVAVAANDEFINIDYSKIYPHIPAKKETDKNLLAELGELSQIIRDPIIVNVMQHCNYDAVSKSRSDGLTNINSSNRYGPFCSGTKRRRAEAVPTPAAIPPKKSENRAKAELKSKEATYNEHSGNCAQWLKDNSSTETLSEIECPNIQRSENLPRKPVGQKSSTASACLKSSHNFERLSVQRTVKNNVLKCRKPCPGYGRKPSNCNKQPAARNSSLQPAKLVQPKRANKSSLSSGCVLSSKTQPENVCDSHEAVSSCQLEHNRVETPFSVEDLTDFCCTDHKESAIKVEEEKVVSQLVETISVCCGFQSIKICHKSVDTTDSELTWPKSKSANVGVAACELTPVKSIRARSIQCKLGGCGNVDRQNKIEDELPSTNLRVKRGDESGIPIKKSCCHSIRSAPAKAQQKKTKRKCILSRLCSKIAKQPDMLDACTESCQEVEHETILNCPTEELSIPLGRQRKSKMSHETGSEIRYSGCNTTCIWKHKKTATTNQVITQEDLQMNDDFQRSSSIKGKSQLVVDTQQTHSLNSTLKLQYPSMKRIDTKIADDWKTASCKASKLKVTKLPKLSQSKIVSKTSLHCGCNDVGKTECSGLSSKLLQSQSEARSLAGPSMENYLPTSSKSANIPSCCNVPEESHKGKLSSSKSKSGSVAGRMTRPVSREDDIKDESAPEELKAKKHFCTLDSCVLKEKRVEKRCISRVHPDSSDVNLTSACCVQINSIISLAKASEVIIKPASEAHTITKNENEPSSEVFSTCMNSCGSGKLKRVLLPAKSQGTDPIKDLVHEYRPIGILTEPVRMIEEHLAREQRDIDKCCSVDEKWIKIVASDNQEFSEQTIIDIIDEETPKSRETGIECAESETCPGKGRKGDGLCGSIGWNNHFELRSKSTQTTSESATRYATSVVAHLISGMKLPAHDSSLNEPQLNQELKVIEAAVSDFEALASANLISDTLEMPKVIESILSGKDSCLLIDRKSVLRSDKSIGSAVGTDVPSLKVSTCSKLDCNKKDLGKHKQDHSGRRIFLNRTAACPSSRMSSQHQPVESAPSGKTASFNQRVPSSKKGSFSPINLKCPNRKSSTGKKNIREILVGDSASEKELKNVEARNNEGSGRCFYLICTNRRPQGSLGGSSNRACFKQVAAGQKSATEVENEHTAANLFNKAEEAVAKCCSTKRMLTKPKNEELACPAKRSDELPTENSADIEMLPDRDVIVETPSGFIQDIIDQSIVVIDRFKLKPKGKRFAALEPKEAKCPERKNQPSQGCCSCPNPHARLNSVAHENFEYRSLYPNQCDHFDIEKQDCVIGQLNVEENRKKLSPCVTKTELNSNLNLNLTNLFKDYAETPSTGSPASQSQDYDEERKIHNDADSSAQNENRRISLMLDAAEPMAFSYNDSEADSQDAVSAAMLFEQFRSEPESNIPSTITVGNVRPMLEETPKAQCKPPEDNVSKEVSSIPSSQTLNSSKSHRTKCFCKEKGCNCKFGCFGNLLHSISDHPVKPVDAPEEKDSKKSKLSSSSFIKRTSSISGLIIGENSSTYNGVAADRPQASEQCPKNQENAQNDANSLYIFTPVVDKSKTESMQTMMSTFSIVELF